MKHIMITESYKCITKEEIKDKYGQALHSAWLRGTN